MSLVRTLLQGKLSVARANIDRIRAVIADIELEKEKATDELVTAKKEFEDTKIALEALPERNK
jgi:predicted  nucleic acid-binding Zn-ribbon protein